VSIRMILTDATLDYGSHLAPSFGFTECRDIRAYDTRMKVL
jgi:hypothetical protein